MFEKNQFIMYGRMGICRVVKISSLEFEASDEKELYYFLDPIYHGGRLYAPVSGSYNMMREVLSKDEAKSLIDEIIEIKTSYYKAKSISDAISYYETIIDSQDPISILALIKSLHEKELEAKSNNKKLGQIDKRFLKKAEGILFGELSCALKLSKEQVSRLIYTKIDESLSNM